MPVVTVPGLADNYSYVVADESTGLAAVVDPVDPRALRLIASDRGWTLRQVWLTHHHPDHTAGVEALCAAEPCLDVLGAQYDFAHRRISGQTLGLEHGEVFALGSLSVRVVAVPGHTHGSIAYLAGSDLFVGDTLFVAGCGRVFEGTMPQMKASLDSLAALPGATRVWCGHEYTVRNLEFAVAAAATTTEGPPPALVAALEEARARVAAGTPTVPSMLTWERAHNPFLRCEDTTLARGRSVIETFTALRRARDAF